MMRHKSNLMASTILLGSFLTPTFVLAQSATDPVFDELRARIEEQAEAISRQQAELEQQRRELAEQRRQIQELIRLQAGAPAVEQEPARPASPPAQPRTAERAPSDAARQAATPPPEDAATRPEERRPEQDITIISDVGGVLTPRGRMTIEPGITASHASSNRFFFQGVEIVDAVLIGAIEATESRRNYLAAQLGVRFGVTNRMEVSAKLPFVYRDDRVESTIISQNPETPGEPSFLQNLDGSGLGDIEFGTQYQLNSGQDGWPFLIANLRAKSTTGKSPFKVDRNADGLETELATGSGFWSVEPSLTMIVQTDPAVFFTNLGYSWNMAKTLDVAIGNSIINRVNPGDSLSASVGMGFALNDEFSISLGYQHNYVFGTKSIINNTLSRSQDFQVGSLLFGMSFGMGPLSGLSMNVAVGVTDESPSVEFSLRMPFSFNLID